MLRIGDLANRSGFSPKTLRYYDAIGLLRPERRHPVTGYREYSPDALTRLHLIQSARKAGLKLKEIKEILTCVGGKSRVPRVYTIMSERVKTLEQHARALKQLRKELENAMRPPRSRP